MQFGRNNRHCRDAAAADRRQEGLHLLRHLQRLCSDQFEADVKLGTPRKDKSMFAANSAKLVRRILDYHDCPEVQLVEGDFTAIDQGVDPSVAAVSTLMIAGTAILLVLLERLAGMRRFF